LNQLFLAIETVSFIINNNMEDNATSKVCSKCNELKPLDCFYATRHSKSGRTPRCKDCQRLYEEQNTKKIRARRKVYAETNREIIRQKDRERNQNPERKKSNSEYFAKNRDRFTQAERERRQKDPDAYNALQRIRWSKNRELSRQRSREYRINNLAKVRARESEYVAIHHDRLSEQRRLRSRANPHKSRAHARARLIAKIFRTPKWLTADDIWMIEEAHALSDLRAGLTGIKWHVDHVIPLRAIDVSGLHVPSNLQVIPASVNMAKHNTFTGVEPLPAFGL
jgi:hypothetical protein